MDIAIFLASGNGGSVRALSQASQGPAALMNSASTQSNQWLSNTNSTMLESDAFLGTIASVNKVIAQVISIMDNVTLNRLRHGSQSKSNDDKTLHSLPDQNGLAARSSNQFSNPVFDLELDIHSKVDEMTNIRKITRIWIKNVPGARLYLAKLGFWKEKCDSWWFFLSERSTEKSKPETWTEARIQNLFMVLEKDKEFARG